jgi:hypothetical protein
MERLCVCASTERVKERGKTRRSHRLVRPVRSLEVGCSALFDHMALCLCLQQCERLRHVGMCAVLCQVLHVKVSLLALVLVLGWAWQYLGPVPIGISP